MSIGPEHYAFVGLLVFAIGLFGVCSRRHMVSILMSLAVMFVGPVIALAGFSASGGGLTVPYGDAVALFVLVVMTAEVLVGVAIALVLWRRRQDADVEDLDGVQS